MLYNNFKHSGTTVVSQPDRGEEVPEEVLLLVFEEEEARARD
jgi:hypothetical protein